MAKAKDLADLTDGELVEKLSESKQELFNLRFQHVTGQLEKHSHISAAKKTVARVLTELRAREIAAAESQEALQ